MAEAEGVALPAQKLVGPYAPHDVCTGHGQGEFLTALSKAVKARDSAALAELAAEDVKLDLGGGEGRAELVRRLDDENGFLWDDLTELLALGCASDGGAEMFIPYFWGHNIPGDAFETYIVTGADIPLRAARGDDARVLARISWDRVVQAEGSEEALGYAKMRWTDPENGEAVTGYIATDRLRSVIDRRLIAASRNGKWSIVSLVAGD